MRLAIAHRDLQTLKTLEKLLSAEADTRIGWMAQSAGQVIFQARSHLPDILLIDVDLPGIPIGRLTQRLMTETPCCILLLNRNTEPCQSKVFEALGQGAADAAILPPPGQMSHPEGWADLLSRLETLRTLTGHARKSGASMAREDGATESLPSRVPVSPVVAIGASTGGPKALSTIMSRLPADLPATVVIVQHLDYHFSQGLAEWLDQSSPLPVSALTRPTPLSPGQAWVAGRPEHVIIDDQLSLNWTNDFPDMICRPSIDVFFNSLAAHPVIGGCGVLLTGMGRDGAAGLLALREAGFSTLAQDEASCVVYGMPRVAASLGAVQSMLPLEEIADHIVLQIKERHNATFKS